MSAVFTSGSSTAPMAVGESTTEAAMSAIVCLCNGRGACSFRHGLDGGDLVALLLVSMLMFRRVDGGVSMLSESISIVLFVESCVDGDNNGRTVFVLNAPLAPVPVFIVRRNRVGVVGGMIGIAVPVPSITPVTGIVSLDGGRM